MPTDQRSATSGKAFLLTQEQVKCALCGDDNTHLLYSIPLQTKVLSSIWVKGERVAVNETATIVACRRCGLHYVNPRWVLDATVTGYTDAMEQQYFADTYAVRQQTYQQFVRRLPEWLGRDVQRLLDIGCGDGVLLEAANAVGITCAGTELSSNLQQLLREKYQGRIEIWDTAEAIPTNNFDVITLINVIEHVAAPYELLATLANKLSDDGILFVHTPNVGGLPARLQGAQWAQIEPLGHLYYFSARTLSAMLQKSGFEPIGRFHLAVSGKLKGSIQTLLGQMGLYLDNGLGIVARRKV